MKRIGIRSLRVGMRVLCKSCIHDDPDISHGCVCAVIDDPPKGAEECDRKHHGIWLRVDHDLDNEMDLENLLFRYCCCATTVGRHHEYYTLTESDVVALLL